MSRRPWIWAPTAQRVELDVGGDRQPCRLEGDRWESPVELEVGTAYRFVLDGEAVPDPRSTAQPEGVHGPSVVEGDRDTAPGEPEPEPDAGAVLALPDDLPDELVGGLPTDLPPDVPADLARAVIYELHLGTFSASGDFRGAIDHLDHLVDLGVTHVEVMPVAAFDGEVGWGYDGVALFAPHPQYGTVADAQEFVAACHRRGLAALLDVVHNHLGPSGNRLAVSGPYFTDHYSTPWGDAVNLDGPGSDGVRRFFIDSALHWLGVVGFDGLRLDAVHALFDQSAVPYLEQLADEVAQLSREVGRPLTLIAESDLNDPRLVLPSPCGPGLDAVWADDLHHCLHVTLTGEHDGYYEDFDAADLPIALAEAYVYQGRHSAHRGRSVGRSTDGTRSEAMVVALQNHDQIGNRATGDRIHQTVGEERAAAAAALLLLSPFPVLVFQGEEWAASTPFPYFSDQPGELGEAIREGRRREFAAFGWRADQVPDPQSRATFESAVLRWDELDRGAHAEQLDWYRTLLAIRRSHPACAPGELPLDQECQVSGSVVALRRGSLTILANLGPHAAQATDLPAEQVLAQRGDASWSEGTWTIGSGATVVLDAE